MTKKPKWLRKLSKTAWVNNVAITDDGRRVVAGTFIHQYKKRGRRILSPSPNRRGTFGTFAYSSTGNLLWSDTYVGWDGVFAVGISGAGRLAAAGGWYDKKRGLVRIYDAANGNIKFEFLDKEIKRVSLISLSRDGGIVAAAANKLYVFVQQGSSYVRLDHPEFKAAFQGKVTAVAVHRSEERCSGLRDRSVAALRVDDDTPCGGRAASYYMRLEPTRGCCIRWLRRARAAAGGNAPADGTAGKQCA